jgi:hypothetical protein
MGIGSVDNIVINNNVLSTEDVRSLLGHMECPDDWDDLMPNGLGCDYYPNGDPVTVKAVPYFFISDDLKPVLFNLINQVKDRLEYKYGQRLVCDPQIWGRVWSIGDFQTMHSDSEYNNSELAFEINGSDPHWHTHIPRFLSDYSSLVYLNDDYEGGEIVFPEYDLTISPKAGEVVTFPTNSMYLHAVNQVKSGTRYNIVLKWFKKTTLISNTMPRNIAIENLVKTF